MDLQALNGFAVISHWTVAAYWLASAVFSDQSRVVLIRTARLCFTNPMQQKVGIAFASTIISRFRYTNRAACVAFCFHEAIIEACIPVRI
jgi:hypothetical protein